MWSPDGSTIAYGSEDRVHLLEFEAGVDRELTFEGFEGLGESPQGFSPDGTRLLIRREAEGPAHDEVVRARGMGIGAGEWRDVIVPVVGGGPAVVLGSEVHRALGGPGGGAIFSPDGTQVLAVYTQPPSGAWLFDVATGRGTVMPDIPSDWITWQRLAP